MTTAFAAAVKAACQQTPAAGRFGNKVWIHAAWAIGRFPMSLESFKAELALASQAGTLVLSRCDLVEAADPRDVRRSSMTRMGATFNFIRM